MLLLRGVGNEYLLLQCPDSEINLMEYLGDRAIEDKFGGAEQLRKFKFRALLATVDRTEYRSYDVCHP